MIINQDNNPQRQLYYLGAKALEILNAKGGSVDFFEVYEQLKIEHNISIRLYVLTVDWLYLLGAIKSDRGLIERCS